MLPIFEQMSKYIDILGYQDSNCEKPQEGEEELQSWARIVSSCVNMHKHTRVHTCTCAPMHVCTHTHLNSVPWKELEASTQLQWALLMPYRGY